ncbi:MAG: 6-phosphogluconolactonase [SAR116 cluster bacterium]|nr:MAG: 6-phosphogluconolactonase [SAR116 cluster bacterium]|tara:strand:- start:706 stop:1320 length:615 start_codon:yes stop_codon:yes gene_type:complete
MVTDLIVRQLAQSLATNGQASLVVCGGSSPLGIFDALAAGEHEDEVDWSKVTITLVDDRLVPADHEHSNQKLLHDHLLRGPVAAANFVPLETNNAAMDIRRPFDVMLLGMGVDGHFASLFPDMVDEASLKIDTPPMILETGPKGSPTLPRVTMNLAMILQSRLLILLVNGAEKQAVLQAAQTDTRLPVHALLKQDVTRLEIVAD